METDTMTKKERRALRKQEKQARELAKQAKQARRKMLGYIAAGLVVAVAGFGIYSQVVPVPTEDKDMPVNQVRENDWYKGNITAETEIVEYSDFACPACAEYAGIVNELVKAAGDKVVITYRHFPLKQIHPRSELAAQAAEAAGIQGKFWEMNEKLFATQTEWAEVNQFQAKAKFVDFAKQLGLDEKQFKQDLNSKVVRGRVKADYLSGLELRLSQTPTFFVNGTKLINPPTLKGFLDLAGVTRESTPAAELKDGE